MEITRQESEAGENLFDYTITDEGKQLHIQMNKEGNLYWLMDDPEPADYASFTITKENEYLYSLFYRLYLQVMKYQKPTKKPVQTTIAGYMLTGDGSITWHSDCDNYDECDTLKMSQVDEEFVLEFVHQTKDFPLYYKPGMFDICFAGKNSRYQPYNRFFINMFEKLQDYDPNYHQVHLEELAYKKKK